MFLNTRSVKDSIILNWLMLKNIQDKTNDKQRTENNAEDFSENHGLDKRVASKI